jgi:hypothetical protein
MSIYDTRHLKMLEELAKTTGAMRALVLPEMHRLFLAVSQVKPKRC